MNAVRNYQKELEKILERHKDGEPASLFLHSCCAPCSSYVLEYLRQYFRITVFYYNPNISEKPEYQKRVEEQKRLIEAYNGQPQREGTVNHRIDVVEGDYEPEEFFKIARGLEQCPEGGERCFACYRMRLEKTAGLAAAGKFDYFATTLTISPLKNAVKLNEIGEELARGHGVSWLPSDFKKRGGYQRSVQLSGEYGLYRQDYCGCIYSRAQRDTGKKRDAG